jgi:hypothetical protein
LVVAPLSIGLGGCVYCTHGESFKYVHRGVI